jgi:predicted molibdopterin-dependent oxidoreductase YjgC
MLPSGSDPIRPGATADVRILVDGETMQGVEGQTIAGVLLGSGRLAWRTTSAEVRPRGVFCGIGVCYDCLVVVNGLRDVRACQRRAVDGDVVTTQHDPLPVVPS